MTAVQNAHLLSDEAEALAVAADLAAQFAEEAAARDAGRQLPYEQVGALAASGLLALGVPREHGGIDARTETLAEVERIERYHREFDQPDAGFDRSLFTVRSLFRTT